MATGSNARFCEDQNTYYLRKRVTFNGSLTGVMANALPDGAIIVRGTVYVWTAFNAGTTNTIDIGVSGAAQRWMSAGALGTAADVAFDDLANSNRLISGNTDVTYAITLSGTAATAGSADIVIEYIANNDR